MQLNITGRFDYDRYIRLVGFHWNVKDVTLPFWQFSLKHPQIYPLWQYLITTHGRWNLQYLVLYFPYWQTPAMPTIMGDKLVLVMYVVYPSPWRSDLINGSDLGWNGILVVWCLLPLLSLVCGSLQWPSMLKKVQA